MPGVRDRHDGHTLAMLIYVFWHWKRPSMDTAEYEAHQRAFHAALAARPPAGFSRSTSSAVTGAPWANGGGAAYEDRYFVRDSAALDALEGGVTSGPRQRAHDHAAVGAAGGTAGLYRVRLGAPPAAPRYASWFSRPEGMSYDQLFALLAPLVNEHDSVLWMRRMVLGPPAEFCLQSAAPLKVPPPLCPLQLTLRPLWPA